MNNIKKKKFGLHKKNKSQNIFCEVNHLKRFNDNFSDKSKFKSTMDLESNDAQKIKNDNLTSASYKKLSSIETGITIKSLKKSFNNDAICNIFYSNFKLEMRRKKRTVKV